MGDYKFNLEVKYKDDKLIPGVESYITVEDHVSLKVVAKDGVATTSGIKNSIGTVIPAVPPSGDGTATWYQPFEGFAGPLTIVEAQGRVFAHST